MSASTAHPAAQREAAFQRGIEAYRTGRHYEAHEIWEELWLSEENDDHRRFLQALIQVTSAMHKMQFNVAPKGSLTLLSRAALKLDGLPDSYGGIDIQSLRNGIEGARIEFEKILRDTQARPSLSAEHIPPLLRVGDALPWQPRGRQEPPDATQNLRRGLAAYKAGRFYDAHAIWEELRLHEPEGPMRTFLHGLIFLASAMHKLFSMKSPGGALKMLAMAEARIAGAPEGTCGMAVSKLVAEIARAKEAIQRMLDENSQEPPREMVPQIEGMGRV